MQELYWLKIFNWIDKVIIDDIIKNSKYENYKIWDFIIKQSEQSNGKWYIISSWEVSIVINLKEITRLWEWEIFWEIWLLNEEERTASVIAMSDVKVLVLNQESIFELINNGNYTINKNIMKRIKENLQNNN